MRRLNAPAWLTARPIAHRGLHDVENGVVENTLAAAAAAVAQTCAIECDVQLSRDEEVFVFHDDTLDRLTDATGALIEKSAAAIARTHLSRATGDTKIPTLAEFLALVAGRVPVVCELKSRFDGDVRIGDRVAALAAGYEGPLALKSFDPAVISHLRVLGSDRPLGMIAEASYEGDYWRDLSADWLAKSIDTSLTIHQESSRNA